MPAATSPGTRELSVVRLLRLLSDKRLTDGDIKTVIYTDPSLIDASNSFCENCGSCCPSECGARETVRERSGIFSSKLKTYCRVHWNEGEPEEFPIRDQDPTGGKPDVCRKVGPGTIYPLASCMEYAGKRTPPCYHGIKKAMVKYREQLADLT